MKILLYLVTFVLGANFAMIIYALFLVNKDNRTEKELIKAKKIIAEKNEKIKLLQNELETIEILELKYD